jgi:hypothetical protein
MPRRNLILAGSLLCCLFYAAHFWRIGAYSAVAMDMIALVQCLASIRFITPERRPPWLTAAFILCLITILGATVATWQGATSAFAALGTVFATVARLQKQAQPMRMLYFASTLCWLGHNLLLDAPLAYLCDVFAVVGLTYSITRELNFSIVRRVFIDYLAAIGHTTKVFRN